MSRVSATRCYNLAIMTDNYAVAVYQAIVSLNHHWCICDTSKLSWNKLLLTSCACVTLHILPCILTDFTAHASMSRKQLVAKLGQATQLCKGLKRKLRRAQLQLIAKQSAHAKQYAKHKACEAQKWPALNCAGSFVNSCMMPMLPMKHTSS